ncbi:MAG TPA: MarR family winged helix-turn-helix transcriptional regulator [Pseudomonadales bacterium]
MAARKRPAVAPAPRARRTRRRDRVLLGTLLHAFYWLDDGLQAEMRRRAGFSLPRAQSMIMVALSEGIATQAELAKRLKVSKQAIQQALRPMGRKGLVRIDPDPDNGRQRLVRVTPRGEAMRDIARKALQALEKELARRIGRDRVEALHEALNADWGPSPGD